MPQSISTSAFTIGTSKGDEVSHMDRMDRGMERGMDPRMDRSVVGGMVDHHRSTSMPVNAAGPMHGRSRSASRGMPPNRGGPGYHSLDRDGYGDREFMPIREPRERSLDRDYGQGSMPPYGGGVGVGGVGVGVGGLSTAPYGRRERSLDRRDMMDPLDDSFYNRDTMLRGDSMMRGDPILRNDPMLRDGGLMGRGPRLSPNPTARDIHDRDMYVADLSASNKELQRDLANLRKELELTNQKLGSSMHSIKTFWSPELKKERALRKEESAKYSLINDQLKLLNSENQVRKLFPRVNQQHFNR